MIDIPFLIILLGVVQYALFYLMVKYCSDSASHIYTLAVFSCCIFAFLAHGYIDPNVSLNYWWFFYAKRLSLLAGWMAFAFLWVVHYLDKKHVTLRVVARRFAQIILMVNVAEAAMLSFQNNDYILFIVLLGLSFFSLDFEKIDSRGRVLANKTATILGIQSLPTISSRNYLRIYYLMLSIPFAYSIPAINDIYFFVIATCLIPLFLQELFVNENEAVFFKIRVFLLIIQASLIDTFINPETINYSSTVFQYPLLKDIFTKNIITLLFVILCVIIFYFLDKNRNKNIKHTKTIW